MAFNLALLSSLLLLALLSTTASATSQDVTGQKEGQKETAPDEKKPSEPISEGQKMPDESEENTSSPIVSGTWKTTFSEDLLQAHVKLSKRKVGVLVAAEDKSLQWEADTAVSALEDVLQGLNNIVFRLSRKGTYDDKRLLKWAKEEEDLDALFIFRPMPVSEGKPLIMVTVYARRGRLLAGFAAIKGDPLPAPATRSVGEEDSLGVSKKALKSIASLDDDEKRRKRHRKQKKKRKKQRRTKNNKRKQNRVSFTRRPEGTEFYTSRGNTLEGINVFKYIKRQDLVKEYKQNETLGTILMVGGGVGVVLGASSILISPFLPIVFIVPEILVGGAFAIGGGVLVWLGYDLFACPISDSTAEEAVRRYNSRAGLFPLVMPTRNALFMWNAE